MSPTRQRTLLVVGLVLVVLAGLIGLVIEKTIGFRVTSEDEIAGIDLVEHGEEGYALSNA